MKIRQEILEQENKELRRERDFYREQALARDAIIEVLEGAVGEYAEVRHWSPATRAFRASDYEEVGFYNGTIGKFTVGGKRARQALEQVRKLRGGEG